MKILSGKIKTGLGTAKYWVNKIISIFDEKFNMKLFLGTLNIELEEEYFIKDADLIIEKEEYGGTQKVLVKKCEIFGNKAFIVRAEKNQSKNGDHPISVIEIVSDINFREKYNLKDNDKIEINV